MVTPPSPTSSTGTGVSQITGLVSGLDTSSIITQLMQLAAQPQTQLKNQVTADQAIITALQGVATNVSAFQTAAEALRNADGWNVTSAASSDSTVVATAAAGASPGSVTFDVHQIARTQSTLTTDTYAGITAAAASGPLTVTHPDGTSATIQVGDGSLQSVVAAINSANAGVRAAAVQVGPSTYRLQLQAAATGAAGAFTLTGLTSTLDTVATAQDAQLYMGGSSTYTVTSASNTISGLLPGVTVSVTHPATNVTVSVDTDHNGLADKVQAMVTAANKALTGIAQATAFDPSHAKSSTLTGNSTVRDVATQVLSAVSTGIAGRSLATVGLSVTKDGQVSFDRDKFLAAYAADPRATQSAFTGVGSVSGPAAGSIAFRMSTDQTQDGTYAVSITRAATHSAGVLDTSLLHAGSIIQLGWATKHATYTVTGTETPVQLAAALSAASQQAGVGVTATTAGANLSITAGGFGSFSAFTMSIDGVQQAVTTGDDVAGTINGVAATGSGQVLTAPLTDRHLGGLALTVSLTPADLVGGPASASVTYTSGIAQRLATVGSNATDAVSGSITGAVQGEQSTITDLQSRIATWDTRLADQQASLQKQYAALEVALGNLKSQSGWLSSQINGLYQYNSSGK